MSVADLPTALGERLKSLAGGWSQYSVLASLALYLTGYLALRFHLTALGIGTDLAVLDERYLFTGARFVVYLVSAVPSVVLVGLPVAAVVWGVHRLLPERVRAGARDLLVRPTRLSLVGIVFAVLVIQLFMRQCFLLSNLLLTERLHEAPPWLVGLALDDGRATLYFGGLVAACAVSLAILAVARNLPEQGPMDAVTRGLLAFLAAVQVLFLPVNYGVLVVDKFLPRVTALGKEALGPGEEAWLVWEGKEGVTFLVRNAERRRRALVTLPRAQATDRIEIVGFDQILRVLHGPRR